MNAVIMAGGSGSRFWPLSRLCKPKQFLELWGEGFGGHPETDLHDIAGNAAKNDGQKHRRQDEHDQSKSIDDHIVGFRNADGTVVAEVPENRRHAAGQVIQEPAAGEVEHPHDGHEDHHRGHFPAERHLSFVAGVFELFLRCGFCFFSSEPS